MKVKSESEVAQPCPTLSNRMDCSPPGSSVHGIFQARVLEWGAIAFPVTDPRIANGPLSFSVFHMSSWVLALGAELKSSARLRESRQSPGCLNSKGKGHPTGD